MPTPTIAILGTGFGGLCAAIQLKQRGIDSFTVFEKADGVGGTWRDNTYPGAACDIPAHFYSFSFERRPDWSRAYARQPEILAYLRSCAEKHGLEPHLELDTEIAKMVFDEANGSWALTASDGRTFTADIVISGLGQLNRPAYPRIGGLDEFAGTAFHSARWNHDVDLAGKKVGVIGNGASAVQFIPEIAEVVGSLTVFQRTPNWVVPKQDPTFTERRKQIFTRYPSSERLYRWSIYAMRELGFLAMRKGSLVGRTMEAGGRALLKSQVPDPELRAELTPDYPAACKRILISNDYYPALMRPNVELVTSAIERADATGLVTADGTHHDFDVLIFGTGFTSTEFLAPMEVVGRDGRELNTEWKDGAEAYLGITVSGFPNLFLLYGPNTNLGHNSIVFMIEAQTRYILRCIDKLRAERRRWIDVRPEAMSEFNTAIQEAVAGTVWASGCDSWYKTDAGKVTNNWPKHTYTYWRETRRPDFTAFELV